MCLRSAALASNRALLDVAGEHERRVAGHKRFSFSAAAAAAAITSSS